MKKLLILVALLGSLSLFAGAITESSAPSIPGGQCIAVSLKNDLTYISTPKNIKTINYRNGKEGTINYPTKNFNDSNIGIAFVTKTDGFVDFDYLVVSNCSQDNNYNYNTTIWLYSIESNEWKEISKINDCKFTFSDPGSFKCANNKLFLAYNNFQFARPFQNVTEIDLNKYIKPIKNM